MINQHWPRWIYASLADRFFDVAEDENIPLLIEGLDDRTAEKIRKVEHAELRINGPFIHEVSHNYFKLDVNVNVLVQSFMGENNAYNIIRNCGTFLEAMNAPIAIYKYGNGAEDDNSYVGCLVLRDDIRNPCSVQHIGQISQEVKLRESVVIGQFRTYLKGE